MSAASTLAQLGKESFFARRNSSGSSRSQRSTTAQDRGLTQSRDDVLGILGKQERITDQNRLLSERDRETAINTLRESVGQRSADYELTREALMQDPGDTPFAAMLRSSIEHTLSNPDVFSASDVANFKARAHESAGQAVRDAITSTRIDNAQRGVEGGIGQGTEQQLRIEAAADVTRQAGEIEFAAAQARAENLAAAKALGVNFETATMNARTSRLQSLSSLVSQAEVRDLELITGVAEILANTVRQNPDYSGFAAVIGDINQASVDLLTQRENLALLDKQIESQERLGLADIELRDQSSRAQNDFNLLLSRLNQQIAGLESDLTQVQRNQDTQRGDAG